MRPDNSTPHGAVICDGFAVTFSPDDSPREDLSLFVQTLGYELSPGSGGVLDLWRRPGAGLIRFDVGARHCRVSVAGQACAFLRGTGDFNRLLSLLASVNHRVTLVDAALDFAIDAPPVLASLRKDHPETCALTRKGIGTWWLMKTRKDGVESGTFYVGHRGKSKVQARVYDKQLELLDKQGIETGPTTRYEISVRGKLGPTLRDVALPGAMFWHFASPKLLQAPSGVDDWESGREGGWSYERPAMVPWQALKRRIEDSADVTALIRLADAVGPSGRSELLRLISDRVLSAPPATST